MQAVVGDQAIQSLADDIRRSKRILVCVGAGISVNAGIPDFRSGNGIYTANRSSSEDVFRIENFLSDPIPFYKLCSEMESVFNGDHMPTVTHHFIKALGGMGKLLRCYSQNVDGLEIDAGLVPGNDLIQCHGRLDSIHCSKCRATADISPRKWLRYVKEYLDSKPECVPSDLCCTECGGFLKPAAVLFGEHLPETFFSGIKDDVASADLLIVIGSTMTVYPFAAITELLGAGVKKYVICKGAHLASGEIVIDEDCDKVAKKMRQLL